MSPRPDVSEERRNQILEAAMAVFARQGFEQARMDDIAQEVGLSKGPFTSTSRAKTPSSRLSCSSSSPVL